MVALVLMLFRINQHSKLEATRRTSYSYSKNICRSISKILKMGDMTDHVCWRVYFVIPRLTLDIHNLCTKFDNSAVQLS